MSPIITTLHTALPAAEPGQVPEWIHVCPAGEFRGRDGRGPYRIEDAQAVILHSQGSDGVTRLVLDENHATDHAMVHGGAAPAAAWMVELQARADGIWSRVEWTERGRALMADRAYRGLSPAIAVDRTSGQVHSIVRASLTNAPNFDLASLHQQEPSMDFHAQLRQALGLASSADEAAIVAAATTRQTEVSTHATQIGQIATAAGVAGKGVPEIVSALTARGDDQGLAGKVVELQTRLDTALSQQAKDRATVVVDAAILAGKPIRALRDHFISRHVQDPTGVETELKALPSINDGGTGGRAPTAAAADGLTADDERVIELMGVDREKYKQRKAAAGLEVV